MEILEDGSSISMSGEAIFQPVTDCLSPMEGYQTARYIRTWRFKEILIRFNPEPALDVQPRPAPV
jgi:hypothetical protein